MSYQLMQDIVEDLRKRMIGNIAISDDDGGGRFVVLGHSGSSIESCRRLCNRVASKYGVEIEYRRRGPLFGCFDVGAPVDG